MTACSISSCEKPHEARGYCVAHLRRWQRYGDPLRSAPPRERKPKPPRLPCVIPGCPTPAHRREWCQAHYRRWRLSGDPLGTTMRERRARRADLAAVFWSRVNKAETCWLWTGPPNSTGYGTFKVNDKTEMVHRYAWTLDGRDLAADLELDHLCRVRLCVRPDHLEPVTPAENKRRSRTTT